MKLAVRHGQNANNTLLASGMTRSAVGSPLEIRYFFGQQARLFYEWIARQRMRDCATLLHSIAITNRYTGFLTMYFRSLWTNFSLSITLCVSVCEFVCIYSRMSLRLDVSICLICFWRKYNNYNCFKSINSSRILRILFYSILLIC